MLHIMHLRMNCAPVVIFAYRRPHHLQRVLEALARNELATQTPLVIYSDAPKNEKAVQDVLEVRRLLKNVTGFLSVEVVERQQNFGLSQSIIDGVTSVVKKYGRVIVVEDDLLTSPFFLKFMNLGLGKYQDSAKVGSVHGYNYPLNVGSSVDFFLRGGDCWGWATWDRAWDKMNVDGRVLRQRISQLGLRKNFDLDNAYPYTEMLDDQIAGHNDSWAIRWHASLFLENMLTLYPHQSLVQNIGMDQSGENCEISTDFDAVLAKEAWSLKEIAIEESELHRSALITFYRNQRHGIKAKIPYQIRRVVKWLKRHL